MNPKIMTLEELKFVGCQEAISFVNNDLSGVSRAWERLFAGTEGIPHLINNEQFWGISSGFGEKVNYYTAARLVSESDHVDPGYTAIHIPRQSFVIFEHKGSVEQLGTSTKHALQWLSQNNYELSMNLNLEMYDARCKPDQPNDYIVDLFFPVKD